VRPLDHAALMQQAARKLGGEEGLRRALGVSWPELQSWLQADAAVPTTVFLKLVDVLSAGAPLAAERREPGHPFLDAAEPPRAPGDIAERALDAAIEAAKADFGNVQLRDAQGALVIRAQRGFGAPFLEFFAAVSGPESACGVAMMTGKPFSVPDVERSQLLRGPAGDAILAAGVRAVHSSPILSPARRLLGVLSVHHRQPGSLDDHVVALLSAIARRAGTLLGSGSGPEVR
jgi:hypothetical protein